MKTSTPYHFSYKSARNAFLERISGADHQAFVHPLPGPDGEIALDLAYWGNRQSEHTIILSSGTHGIEGYCGSYVQCALLDEGLARKVAEKASLLMIHGVNPYGFAWQRRVNEDNIDLNRNFVDHTKAYPVNQGYEEIAKLLEPKSWTENTSTRINQGLAAATREHKEDSRWLQAAMTGGQFKFPNGQFYGGIQPSWSNQRVMEVARKYLPGQASVWIDVHTALGEFGTAQCIVDMPPSSDLLHRATSLWGDRLGNIGTQSSVATPITGLMLGGVERMLDQPLLSTYLEYGTVPAREVGEVLIQDQWLHRHGKIDSEFGRQTKARMMNTFYPDYEHWREAILNIARDVIGAAANAL